MTWYDDDDDDNKDGVGGWRTGRRREFPQRAGEMSTGKTSNAAEEDTKENVSQVSTD